MENNLGPIALTPTKDVAQSPAPAAQSASTRVPDAADLRLVIEKDADSGLFIYKTINSRTGAVIQQLPREEVVRMHQAPQTQPGAIIKTTA